MKYSAFAAAAIWFAIVNAAPSAVDLRTLSPRANLVNEILGQITGIPPLDLLVDDVCGVITGLEVTLADITHAQYDYTVDGCADVTLIYARGTCDPDNIGVLVGAPFVQALKDQMDAKSLSLSVVGVEYPASVGGYLSADRAAGDTMRKQALNTMKSCPNSKIVLSGYSQGNYAVHYSTEAFTKEQSSKISSAVLFGDPLSRKQIKGIPPSKVKTFCHTGDFICNESFLITPAHLSYAVDADEAAAFIAKNL